MAITVGATITKAGNSSFGAPPSPTHTVDAATTVTVIFVHVLSNNTQPTAVSLNGVSATKLLDSDNTGASGQRVQFWGVANPTSGTISVTGGNDDYIVGAINLKGADTSLVLDGSGSAGTSSSTTNQSVTNNITSVADGDIYISGCSSLFVPTTGITNANGETTAYDIDFGSGTNRIGAVNYFIQTTHGARSDGFVIANSGQTIQVGTILIKASTSTAWTKTLTESAAISDTLRRSMTRPLAESATFTDSLSIGRLFTKILTELATITDALGRSITKLLSETATLTENFVRSIARTFTESLTITDSFARLTTFILTFVESFSVTDSIRKTLNSITDIWSDLFSGRGSSWNDKLSKRNSSYGDKFSSRGSSYNDKFTHH